MNKQETIQRWAAHIVPAVFRAEQQLLESEPQWRERLKKVEDATQTAQEYCEAIANEVIEQENYTDWLHDLSKQKYQYYLPIPKKGGEE